MEYSAFILAILQAIGQFGPAVAKSISDLVHGNPKQQDETDEAYIARVGAQIETKAADTTATDQAIIDEVVPPPVS